jgi:hypothetical protein
LASRRRRSGAETSDVSRLGRRRGHDSVQQGTPDLLGLAERAVADALADAGIGPGEVQEVFFGNAAAGLLRGQGNDPWAGAPARHRAARHAHGQRRISADTALRLSRFFGTSERFWINLQARHDLEVEKDRLGDALAGIRPLSAAS